MAVRWTYFTGTINDDDADSLVARLGVNDATETTVIAPNGIAVDDAVTDATVNGKTTLREKTRPLKKGKKVRS